MCPAPGIDGRELKGGARPYPMCRRNENELIRRALHTPCHTQDSTCFYLEDTKTDQRGVLTGYVHILLSLCPFFSDTPVRSPQCFHASMLSCFRHTTPRCLSNHHIHTDTLSDTLFIAGCGRFFEGTPTEMHAALTKLGNLPDDTVVYNGHEYTAGSAKFGLKIEPDNKDLQG